jgi:hypothetical protein
MECADICFLRKSDFGIEYTSSEINAFVDTPHDVSGAPLETIRVMRGSETT